MASTTITVPGLRTDPEAVRHFFGTRQGPLLMSGPAGVRLQGGGLPETVLVVSVKQVHGTDVLVIDAPGGGRQDAAREAGWDAMVTNQPNVLLTVRTADCVPVLIHDPVRRVVAAVHAGWRGTVAGILPLTFQCMAERFGVNPHAVRVGIGPSIGLCCYEVDGAVLDRVRAGGVNPPGMIEEIGNGKARLDLGALVRAQTEVVGVPPEGIERVELCTRCHPDMFYSYRRDGTVLGTMVSGVMLLPRARAGRGAVPTLLRSTGEH